MVKFGYAKTWEDYVRLINRKYFEHTQDNRVDFALLSEDEEVLKAYSKMISKKHKTPETEIK